MHHLDWQRYAAHTLLALGVSGLLLALLARFSLASADTSLLPRMVEIVTSISATSLLLYLAAIGARTVFQALRYRLILGATEDSVPGFFHLLLVTASRNMFVDMLPARLGELSYVAMLNRGYRVGLPACLSSLAISFARLAPSTAPLSASFFDSVMAWPLLFSVISTAMSFLGPPMPSCTP